MSPNEAAANEPQDTETRYDLAGNPLPPEPRRQVPLPASAQAAPLPGPAGYAPAPGYAAPSSAASAGPRPAYTPAARSGLNPMLFVGLGAAVLVVIGMVFGLKALFPKVVIPTAYKTYTAIDSSFSCDQPAAWTLHETGATSGNLATASFSSGAARVRVISDATGSLMGDAMGSSNPNLPPEQQVPAVEKLHIMDKKQLAASLPDYDEGEMQKIQSNMGDSRVSEWTAGGGLHGYRVTMLGREREFTVICMCPEANWPSLRPAFQRIIGSVKPGNPS